MTLPGIGEARARAILELRDRLGGFDAIDRLRDVLNVGQLNAIRDLITV